ncbi:DNA polymerase/3'-5' exonuclease PolX [Halobacteriales archaeon QS_8_69_26]|nr:MAG: DNA polymerase/3'-5' exonuclease PolX [Halobacteriales archaeon QS_8_69_26]
MTDRDPATITNDELAGLFEEMADLLEAQDVEYKPRAYRRAAENVREQPVRVATLAVEDREAVEEIEGVGDAIAAKIAECVETGEIEELEEQRERLPVEMDALTRVEGVGPKTVGTLYEALGIRTLDDLEAAAEAGEIQEVRGFGAKTEGNILENLQFARTAAERSLLGEARPLADALLARLREHDAVERCDVGGSIRRWRPTVGDLDVLVASTDPPEAVEAFTGDPRVETVIEAGTSKAAARSRDGIRVDLRVVEPDQFGSALQYFTGSKDHNVRLRTRALDRRISLNEYGAFEVDDGGDGGDGGSDAGEPEDPDAEDVRERGTRIAGETEASMYEAVGLPPIPPELREDRGEIDAAEAGDLPDLVGEGDPRGDLHTHTRWSDGEPTIRESAEAAAEFGHDYLAVTDHATGPGMVGGVGLDDEELREQMVAVREVDDDLDDVAVFAGVEANVDAGGDLSVADDVLADLDVVVASPHSGLDAADDASDRLVRAIEHPSVDVLGHPTGRLLGRRSGLTIDPERLGRAAADHGVALEVNANPSRLDLSGAAVKPAVEAGAPVAVNTDAHRPSEFANVRYGVHTARRGWAEPADVVNAWPVDELRDFLE